MDLRDGLRIVLNTDTALTVHLGANQRRVDLTRGARSLPSPTTPGAPSRSWPAPSASATSAPASMSLRRPIGWASRCVKSRSPSPLTMPRRTDRWPRGRGRAMTGNKVISKLYQHLRVRVYGPQESLSTLRLLCSPFPRPRHRRKTPYGWMANPYPTGAFTQQGTPIFSCPDNDGNNLPADSKRSAAVGRQATKASHNVFIGVRAIHFVISALPTHPCESATQFTGSSHATGRTGPSFPRPVPSGNQPGAQAHC